MADEAPSLALNIDHPDLLVGVIEALGVVVGPSSSELAGEIERAVAARAAGAASPYEPEALRPAVRDLLRRGGYKPTGRGRPSSEYIANAARRGQFPHINNVVDIANLVSLESGLPVSLLDLDRAVGNAPGLEVRFGMPGESFVFNASGQVIDVSGLICVARRSGPAVANPVKDASVSKTDDSTKRLLAVVYGPGCPAGRAGLDLALLRFAALLSGHARAGHTRAWLLEPDRPPTHIALPTC